MHFKNKTAQNINHKTSHSKMCAHLAQESLAFMFDVLLAKLTLKQVHKQRVAVPVGHRAHFCRMHLRHLTTWEKSQCLLQGN